jgi:hypothetical protein
MGLLKIKIMKVLITLFLLVLLMASSCVTNGYGCHGHSKIMTHVR